MNETFEKLREGLPVAVGKVAQIVCDNPGQFALLVAGGVVASSVAHNIARPRTVIEILALQVIIQAAIHYACGYVLDHELLRFRVRDDAGKLIPFEPTKLKAVS